MAAFPRRRSLWLKVAVLGGAVWLTVCFLLYTEDRNAADVQGLAPSGVAAPQIANEFVPPAALRRETPGNPSKSEVNQQLGPEQGTKFVQIYDSLDRYKNQKSLVICNSLSPD